jgi:F-type H+-transporting ATPase subunit epsilon
MAACFKLEIVTPYRLFYSEDVEFIKFRVEDGDVGVFAGHSVFTAPIATCILEIRDKKGVKKFAFIADGIVEVKKNKTVLLVDSANWPEEIDIERATIAKNDAKDIYENGSFRFEHVAAKQKLLRAATRLKVAQMQVK